MTGGFTTYATFDAIRRSVLLHMYKIYRFFTNIYHVLLCRMGDDCINRLTKKNCIIDKKFWAYRPNLLIIDIHQFSDWVLAETPINCHSKGKCEVPSGATCPGWRGPWANWPASAVGERARWEREAHWQARLSGRTLVRRGYFLSLWTEPLLFDDTEAEAVCVADQGQCGHAGEPGSNFATSHYRWRYWGRKGCVISATLIYHNFHVAIHLSKYIWYTHWY